MARGQAEARWVLSPGLADAPVLDRLCSHFVLTLTLRQAGRFNLRRDCNSLLALTGRHLVWPPAVLARLRAYLRLRCKGNEAWRGHEALADEAFIARHGAWRGAYEEGSLFFYLDEYVKDAPKDLLAVLGASCDWLERRLKKEATLVEKNIDALAGLLQLNPAERALLLYGTLARYQRDLRGLLVEFKVSSAQEAYAAIASVAGVDARDVAEALRAGSRLERVGMVENLISEHNITDLADLMKVSEQLPPVLMREYPQPGDLMAVFTRPATKSELTLGDFGFVADDAQVLSALLRNAVARKEAGVNVLLYGPPGTGKTELAKVCADGGRAGAVRGGVRRPRRQFAVRPRPLPQPADQPGVPQGRPRRGAALRRGRGRVPADLQRGRAADRAPGQRRRRRRRHEQQRQRQGLGQPDPRDQPGAGDLGDQPHRADRPGLPPPLPVPPAAEESRRRARARRWSPGRWRRTGERRLRRQAGRAARPDAGADPHRGALCAAGPRRRRRGRPRRPSRR